MKYLIDEKNKSGIYIITNSINNKVYIGSAVNLHTRFIGHKHQFNKNKHNERFQNFVNKYGSDVLSFCLIEYCDKERLIEREQYWIDYYQSYKSKLGYNISKNAGSTLGCKMPESHKNACKERMKGTKLRLGKKWSKEEKIKIGERSKSFWADNPHKREKMGKKISEIKKGVPQWIDKPHPALGKPSPRRKKVALIDKNNNILNVFSSTVEAAQKLNLDYAAISRVCNNKYKNNQTKGYRFRWFVGEPSSKLCECGELNNNLTLADRVWICEKCGVTHQRDLLAARNIKKFGLQKQNLSTVGMTGSVC